MAPQNNPEKLRAAHESLKWLRIAQDSPEQHTTIQKRPDYAHSLKKCSQMTPKPSKKAPKNHQRSSKIHPKMRLWTGSGRRLLIHTVFVVLLSHFWYPLDHISALLAHIWPQNGVLKPTCFLTLFFVVFLIISGGSEHAFHTVFTSRNTFLPFWEKSRFFIVFDLVAAPF